MKKFILIAGLLTIGLTSTQAQTQNNTHELSSEFIEKAPRIMKVVKNFDYMDLHQHIFTETRRHKGLFKDMMIIFKWREIPMDFNFEKVDLTYGELLNFIDNMDAAYKNHIEYLESEIRLLELKIENQKYKSN